MHIFHKVLNGMSNNKDVEQSTPSEQSDPGQHCLLKQFCQKSWCMMFQNDYGTYEVHITNTYLHFSFIT